MNLNLNLSMHYTFDKTLIGRDCIPNSLSFSSSNSCNIAIISNNNNNKKKKKKKKKKKNNE